MVKETKMESKEEAAKRAEDNWRLAREWDRSGEPGRASEARQRAVEAEKCRDSWLYRMFGL
jgi:hypothetical protein